MSKQSIELLEKERAGAIRMRDQHLQSVETYQNYAERWSVRVKEIDEDIRVLKGRLVIK